MNQELGVMLSIYAIRGIVGFANYWFIFENFFTFPKNKWQKKYIVWIIIYGIIVLTYRPLINYGPRALTIVMIVLYNIAIVPFLWARYSKKTIFLAIAIFYESFIGLVFENIKLILFNKIDLNGYPGIEGDIFLTISEIGICVVLLIFVHFNRIYSLRIYFVQLTIAEYIILSVFLFTFGILETAIFTEDVIFTQMKVLCVVVFVLFMVILIHIMLVRVENTSMNNMIGDLKEPMKQITNSYIEMNEKNTELRRFRHDTKNLLLVLHSLISEKKYDQADEYISKIQETMDSTKAKAFDTGNFIADALLESKARVAAESGVSITVDGFIPASKVEDVNLVILISNLLDNAIEAARQVEGKRYIEIRSILKKNIWVLSVKNSCAKDVTIIRNRIETTKHNKESHGFGLTNIESITHKYNGNLKLECENKVFRAQATLMLTS